MAKEKLKAVSAEEKKLVEEKGIMYFCKRAKVTSKKGDQDNSERRIEKNRGKEEKGPAMGKGKDEGEKR